MDNESQQYHTNPNNIILEMPSVSEKSANRSCWLQPLHHEFEPVPVPAPVVPSGRSGEVHNLIPGGLVRPKASVRSASVTPQMQVHFCHKS